MPIYVNEVEITDDEVHEEMKHHPASSIEDARDQAARALVIRQLLLQAALEKQLLRADESKNNEVEEAAIHQLLNQEVHVPEADEDCCRHYYEQNYERFLDKTTGNKRPFDTVKDQINHYLHARSLMTGISQYIQVLSSRAKIIGFNLMSSDGPLTQ